MKKKPEQVVAPVFNSKIPTLKKKKKSQKKVKKKSFTGNSKL